MMWLLRKKTSIPTIMETNVCAVLSPSIELKRRSTKIIVLQVVIKGITIIKTILNASKGFLIAWKIKPTVTYKMTIESMPYAKSLIGYIYLPVRSSPVLQFTSPHRKCTRNSWWSVRPPAQALRKKLGCSQNILQPTLPAMHLTTSSHRPSQQGKLATTEHFIVLFLVYLT